MDDPPPPYFAYNKQDQPQPQHQPPPPGFQAYPPDYPPVQGANQPFANQPQNFSQNYGTTQYPTVTVQPVSQQVIIVGGCPACRVGVLEDDYTCCGVCCAIFFFPLGILWCLATRQRRCANCGVIFG